MKDTKALAEEALAGIPKLSIQDRPPMETLKERYELWASAPDAVSEGEHEAGCLEENFYWDDRKKEWLGFPCPICEHRKMIEKLRKRMMDAGIATRYLEVRFADLEKVDPVPRVQKACTKSGLTKIRESGSCLLLSGPPGGGKTQLATLIAKHAILYGYTVSVVNLGALCVAIRDGYGKVGEEKTTTESDTVRALGELDFLILDDLGAGESDNAKVESRVLYLVSERRQNYKLPTVITTNLNQADLVKTIGSRIFNRFMPLTVIDVKHGKNFRAHPGEELW